MLVERLSRRAVSAQARYRSTAIYHLPLTINLFYVSAWSDGCTPAICSADSPGPMTFISSTGRYSYASQVTTGVTVKFSVGGGLGVRHSSPVAGQGFAGAKRP